MAAAKEAAREVARAAVGSEAAERAGAGGGSAEEGWVVEARAAVRVGSAAAGSAAAGSAAGAEAREAPAVTGAGSGCSRRSALGCEDSAS